MVKAVRFHQYGDIDVLRVEEVGLRPVAENEVVVQVRAAGINPGEAKIRQGLLHERFPATFPSGEGSDLAGTVAAIGDDVTEWLVGDDVLGWSLERSSHAEQVVVPAGQLVAKPPALSWEVAGSLYVAGCTAFAAVRAVDPTDADTVAVSGAATSTDVLAEIAELAKTGKIEVPIAATYPLDQVRAAFAELEQGHTLGKIVLMP